MPSKPTLPDPPFSPSKHRHDGETTATALHLFMLVALYAIPIFLTLRPLVVDADIWWHLRVGQWVVEHGAVPQVDPFSRGGADKSWVAYSWLFEVLVYRLYEWFGLAGIVAYRLVLSVAIVAALHRLVRRHEPRIPIAVGLTATAALALAPSLTERPWLFTILFSILTLDLLLQCRAGQTSHWFWALPVVYALWANLHIQFVYGLMLLGLACAATGMDAWLGRRRGEPNGLAFSWRVAALAGLCFLATLVNPYHARLYHVVVEYATQPGPFRCIQELCALEFREIPDWVGLFLGAAAVFALGRRRRLSSFEVLLLAGAGVLAFRSRRDLWFLVVAALAILATQGSRPTAAAMRLVLAPRQRVAMATVLVGLIALIAWQRGLSEENLRRKMAAALPVEAAAVVAERGDPGPLYNDFNWGGFLIWSLPQLPVVLDGRTNLHGDERILRIGNTWAAGPGWRDDPDLSAAGVIIADTHTPLAGVLVLDERFQLVYEDPVARVFVRKQLRSAMR